MSSPTTIGLIGLGLMGKALAGRMLEAGHELLGFDITPRCREEFAALGGTLAAGAGAILATCDVVLMSLPTYDVVQAVLETHAADCRAGQLLVDTTTGAPEMAAKIAGRLAERGVTYLDATVSGSSAQLRAGEVLWMVGGDRAGFERCADLLRCLGREVVHTGAAGSGAKMKLVTNLVLGLNRAALAEGLALAHGLQLDLRETLSVLQASAAYSKIMDSKGEKMITGDFSPVARLSQHLKDVRLILAAGEEARVSLPLSDAHVALLEDAETRGFGPLDNSAIAAVYFQRPPQQGSQQH